MEWLEDRTLLAVFDVQGATASYLASAHVTNQVLLAQAGAVIQLIDTGEIITLTNAARQVGCLGDGTNTILCPAGLLTRVSLDTGDGNDHVEIQPAGMTAAVDVLNAGGITNLVVDDSGDRLPQSATLAAGSLAGMGPSVTFAAATLRSLTITGGGGGNTFHILDTPGSSSFPPTTVLKSGAGADVVNVRGTTGRLVIDGQGGHDRVTVGGLAPAPGGTLAGIAGDILVTNATSFTDLVVDDSGDMLPARAMLLRTSVAELATTLGPADLEAIGRLPLEIQGALLRTSYVGRISDLDAKLLTTLAPQRPSQGSTLGHPFVRANIYFLDRLRSLTVNGGRGENTFLVLGTPSGPSFTATTLRTGTGQDVVDVQRTMGPLVIDGQAGRDQLTMGTWDRLPSDLPHPPQRTLAGIQGRETIDNQRSRTDVVVDDSGDPAPLVATLGADHFEASGAAPIDFTSGALGALTIKASRRGNSFTVADTMPGLTTTLATGEGDQVNVLQATGLLKVVDQTSSARITGNPFASVLHVRVHPPIPFNAPIEGTLAGPGDVDLYPIVVTQPGRFSVQVQPKRGRPLDARVALYTIDSYLNLDGLRVAGGGLLAASEDQAPGNTAPSLSLFLLPSRPSSLTSFSHSLLNAFTYYVTVSTVTAGGDYTLTPTFLAGTNPFPGLDVDPAHQKFVGTNPVALVAADVNGDGILDLVTANQGSGDVSVLLGVGDGSFESQVRFPVGGHPAALVAKDFNNDGRIDLATLDGVSGQVTILPGVGDGTFSVQTAFHWQADAPRVAGPRLFPYGPVAQAHGDFNRDGYADLAALVPTAVDGQPGFESRVALQFGIPDDSQASIDTPLDPIPAQALLERNLLLPGDGITPTPSRATPLFTDLNGDGVPDVVTVSRSGDILFRAGRPGQPGAFAPSVVVNGTGTPRARAIAIVTSPVREVVGIDLFSATLSLYRRQPDGTWERRPGPGTGVTPDEIVAGDLDGDGRTDLVVANNLTGLASLSFYRGEADGRFTRVRDIKVGTAISDLELADVNGDGRLDSLITNADTGDVGVLLNQGLPGSDIRFGEELRLRAGSGERGVGESVATQGANTVFAAFGIPNAYPPLYVVIAREETASVAAADFTGDGVPDLVLANHRSNALGLLQGKTTPSGAAAGSLSDPLVISYPHSPSVVRAGDFDQDGRQDLVVLNQDESTVTLLRGNGRGGLTPGFTTSAGSRPTGLSVFDVNCDGILDVVVGNQFGDVLTLLGNRDGTLQPPPPFTGDRAPLDVQLLRSNGQPEVLVANQQHNRVVIQTAAPGSVQFSPAVSLADSAQQTVLAPGAVKWHKLEGNQSPFFDAVVMGSGSNNVLVYRATGFDAPGQPTFASPVSYSVGSNPVGVTIQDLNGDGVPDMLVANQGSNDVSVLFGSLDKESHWVGTPGPRLHSGGQGPLGTTLRDLNSDGIPDLVVTNNQSATDSQRGNLAVLLGRGQGFFDDRTPQILSLPGNPIQAPSFFGASGVGVVPGTNGGVFDVDLGNASTSTRFTPPAGRGVTAVEALADGNVLAAEQGGTVLLLQPMAGSSLLAPGPTLTALTGIPSDPSALAVLETASGLKVLVTNQGEDDVFVFAFGPPSPPAPPFDPGPGPGPVLRDPVLPAPVAEASALTEVPLTLVLTLVAGNLPTGEAAADRNVGLPGTLVQSGGGDEEDVPQTAPAPNGDDSTPGLDDGLRQLDLYRRTDDPDADGPMSRSTTPARPNPWEVAWAAVWEAAAAGLPLGRWADPEADALASAAVVFGDGSWQEDPTLVPVRSEIVIDEPIKPSEDWLPGAGDLWPRLETDSAPTHPPRSEEAGGVARIHLLTLPLFLSVLGQLLGLRNGHLAVRRGPEMHLALRPMKGKETGSAPAVS